jgi:2-polyprenyl-3-methyl-5-hydroxy-6-metoxy-1,4-benzoquinol methylase
MYHYLEHTADPAAELDAATALLAPGGHLMVEVPDPRLPWHGPPTPARRLARGAVMTAAFPALAAGAALDRRHGLRAWSS